MSLRMTEEARRLAELHDKDAQISDHYYVFATAVPDSWIGGDPHRVADFYRRRWGIENSYKSYDKLYGMSLRLCSDSKRRHRRIRRDPDENGQISSHMLQIYMIDTGIPPRRRSILRRVHVLARPGSEHINAPI